MEKKKLVTRYIPAGMNLASLNPQPAKYRTKKCKPISFDKILERDIFLSEDEDVSTQVVTSPPRKEEKERQKMKPPRTICANKSLCFDEYNIKITETPGFQKIPSEPPLVEETTEAPVSFKAKMCERLKVTETPALGKIANEPCLVEETITPPLSFKAKMCERLKVTETPALGKIEIEPPHVEQTTSAPVSFKAKMCERLQRHKLKKQNASPDSTAHSSERQVNIQKCECRNCDKFVSCTFWLHNNVTFDETAKTVTKGLPLLKGDPTDKEISIFKTFNKIILHGVVIPKPLFSLDETNIDANIQKAMVKINCASSKDVQSYMWPAVQRGLNTFMIAAPKSGKTLAYLPAFCSFAMEKNDRYAELAQYTGPLIIILCPTSKNCNELHDLITELVVECWDAPVVEVLTENSPVQSDCDILVTVPSVLEECLKAGKVSLKRLCHLAIEDGYFLLKNHNQSMEKLLKIINIAQTNRPHNKNIQIVVSSEKWSSDLELLLRKLYVTPLVCFEDFLEAAVYSKVEFKKKKLKSLYKLFYLDDVLKGHYMTHKAVVFCEEEEIATIKEHLEISGVECITISNDLIEDGIFENEDMWRSLPTGQYKVFLCTDALFERTARVLNANWVVHYSLPSNWTQFQKRFRCLVENLCSPFDVSDSIYKTNDKCSFLLIDEACDNQIFLDFFEVLTRNLVTHLLLK